MTNRSVQEEFYQIFMQHSPDGYWYSTLREPMPTRLAEDDQIDHLFNHATIADCNLAFAKMYGFSRPEELLNTPLLLFLAREEEMNLQTLQSFIRAGYTMRSAITHESDRHGKPRWFKNYVHGTVENNLLVSIWGHQTDITEEHRKENDRTAFLSALSTQQRLILFLLLDNYSLKEAAKLLNITYNTAHTHCYRILKHHAIADIASLIHYARQLGITTTPAWPNTGVGSKVIAPRA